MITYAYTAFTRPFCAINFWGLHFWGWRLDSRINHERYNLEEMRLGAGFERRLSNSSGCHRGLCWPLGFVVVYGYENLMYVNVRRNSGTLPTSSTATTRWRTLLSALAGRTSRRCARRSVDAMEPDISHLQGYSCTCARMIAIVKV